MNTDDLLNRILDNQEKYDDRLNMTCTTVTKIETILSDFISSASRKNDEIKANVESRYKKLTAIFGSITIIGVIIGIVRALS